MLSCCFCSPFLICVGLFLLILKIYNKLTTGVYKGTERLDGKTFVVTGANSGIGLESVKDFAKRGAKVIMVCRDMVKGERVRKEIMYETGNSNLHLVHVDFSKLASVRNCAREIIENEPRIDVLLNNAGAGGEGFKKTEDGLDRLMQTNYFGPFLLTNLLLDRIRASAPSRIVNVSSLAHKYFEFDVNNLGMKNITLQMKIYCHTKLCNVLFSNELSVKLKGTGVTVNSLHPGVIKTDITRNAPMITKIFWNTIFSFFKTVAEGAQTSIYLCVSPDVKNVTGQYFEDCKQTRMSPRAKNVGVARKLWELSAIAVGLPAEH